MFNQIISSYVHKSKSYHRTNVTDTFVLRIENFFPVGETVLTQPYTQLVPAVAVSPVKVGLFTAVLVLQSF